MAEIEIVCPTVTQLPFPSGYFDAVVSEDVLGHIPFDEKEKTYSEMYRVLRLGGLMVHAALHFEILGQKILYLAILTES